MQELLTVGDVMHHLSASRGQAVPMWRVRRIVDGIDVNFPRAGGYRLIPSAMLPAIEERLDQILSRGKVAA